jgi:hypothetical protein
MLHGKKLRPATAIIVIVIAICLLLNYFVFKPSTSFSNFDAELKKTEVELNKMCPYAADEETRMDKVAAPGKSTLIYYLTLVNVTKETFDTAEFKSERYPVIIDGFKTGNKMKLFRDNDAIVIYRFHDKNGAFLLNLSVGPKEYRQRTKSDV